jgi:hypothetical protein
LVDRSCRAMGRHAFGAVAWAAQPRSQWTFPIIDKRLDAARLAEALSLEDFQPSTLKHVPTTRRKGKEMTSQDLASCAIDAGYNSSDPIEKRKIRGKKG